MKWGPQYRLFQSPCTALMAGSCLPAIRAVQRDCHWGMKNGGNSHWSREPIMQWSTRQSQSIFRPTNGKREMQAIPDIVVPTASTIATWIGLWSSLASISNYIHLKQWDVLTHSCPLLKLGHEWVITSYTKNYGRNYLSMPHVEVRAWMSNYIPHKNDGRNYLSMSHV